MMQCGLIALSMSGVLPMQQNLPSLLIG